MIDRRLSRRALLRRGGLLAGSAVAGRGGETGEADEHIGPPSGSERRDSSGGGSHRTTAQVSDGGAPRTDLGVLWERSVSAGRRPAYVDDTLLISSNEGLIAVDPESGSQQYQIGIGDLRLCTPDPGGGAVYVTIDEGQTNRIYAVDLSGRDVLWETSTEYIDSANTGIPYAMTATADRLFAAANGAGVYALSTDTGSVDWQFTPPADGNPYTNTTPAVSDDRVFVTSFETGDIYAIERSSGTLDWSRGVGAEIFHPLLANGNVYVSGGDQVWALDAASGGIEWTRDIQYAAEYDGGGAHDGETLFLTGRSDGQYLYGLDLESGATEWRTEAPTGRVRLAGDTLYVINRRSPIVTVDPRTGTKLDSIDRGTHATIAGNRIYASDMWNDEVLAIGEGAPANFTVTPSTPTTDEDVRFAAETNESISQYEWAIEGRDITVSNPEFTTTFSGPYPRDVTLRVTTADGITTTTTRTVPVETSGTDGLSSSLGLLVGGVGLALIGIGVPVAYRRRRAGSDEDDAASDSDIDGWEDAYESAEEALATAEAARDDGEYEAAIDHYENAEERYEAARERLPPDNDRREDVGKSLATIRDTLDEIRARRDLLSDVSETLSRAEENLQTAITAHANGRTTVPRLRYRQARDRYERALETVDDSDSDPFALGPITVTRETGSVEPPATVDALPALGEGRTLAEAGIRSRTDFDEADQETLEELSDVFQTVATAWWRDEVTTTFTDRSDVESRYEAAQTGYDAV